MCDKDNNKDEYSNITKKELFFHIFPYLIVGIATLSFALTIIIALSTIGNIGASVVEAILFSVWIVSYSLFCYSFNEDGIVKNKYSKEYLKYIFKMYIKSTIFVYLIVLFLLFVFLITKFFGYQLLVL